MDVLDCVSPQAIALRKDQIRFFAPSSTQRSFMDAILRSTPDTTYLYGSHYSPAREDRIPQRFDPETIVKLAERLKITGLLPVHVFLNLQYSTTGMLQDSTGRPGLLPRHTHRHLLSADGARTLDRHLGLDGTPHALANFATTTVPAKRRDLAEEELDYIRSREMAGAASRWRSLSMPCGSSRTS